jgi:hypothetical protein
VAWSVEWRETLLSRCEFETHTRFPLISDGVVVQGMMGGPGMFQQPAGMGMGGAPMGQQGMMGMGMGMQQPGMGMGMGMGMNMQGGAGGFGFPQKKADPNSVFF